jgi:integrase
MPIATNYAAPVTELSAAHRLWPPWGGIQGNGGPRDGPDPDRSVLDAHLLPEFAAKRIETITTEQIERWRNRLAEDGTRVRHTVNKIVTQLHAIFQHAVDHHGLIVNPVAKVRRLRESYDAARFDFYSPEEIEKLVATAAAGAHRDPRRPAVSDTERALRAAEDRQDSAIYLTAALSGLRRGELLALRWEDVDFEQSSIRVFEGYSANTAGKPKSRKSRTLPMVEEVAHALTDLKDRSAYTAKGDLVFVSREGTHVDGSALRRRYHATLDAAGLRRLRFHDLRHTFGSLAINVASIVQVQAWMGHADIQTTMRYLHHKSRADDAQLLSTAFRLQEAQAGRQALDSRHKAQSSQARRGVIRRRKRMAGPATRRAAPLTWCGWPHTSLGSSSVGVLRFVPTGSVAFVGEFSTG